MGHFDLEPCHLARWVGHSGITPNVRISRYFFLGHSDSQSMSCRLMVATYPRAQGGESLGFSILSILVCGCYPPVSAESFNSWLNFFFVSASQDNESLVFCYRGSDDGA